MNQDELNHVWESHSVVYLVNFSFVEWGFHIPTLVPWHHTTSSSKTRGHWDTTLISSPFCIFQSENHVTHVNLQAWAPNKSISKHRLGTRGPGDSSTRSHAVMLFHTH